jgi:hypothetical protein
MAILIAIGKMKFMFTCTLLSMMIDSYMAGVLQAYITIMRSVVVGTMGY